MKLGASQKTYYHNSYNRERGVTVNNKKIQKEMGISPKQVDNLNRLADYLSSENLDAKFDMEVFQDGNMRAHPIRAIEMEPTTCGTVGCAVGHGPYAGIPKEDDESWVTYSERVFITQPFGDHWKWCFSSDWAYTDNTPIGAAKRIQYMLEFGLPDDWEEQLSGSAEKSYG